MTAPFTFDLTYGYRCAFCGAQHRVGHMVVGGTEIPFPAPPRGWHVIDHAVFCPVHVVEIRKQDES